MSSPELGDVVPRPSVPLIAERRGLKAHSAEKEIDLGALRDGLAIDLGFSEG